MAAMSLTGDEGSSGPMSFLGKERYRETLHGRKEASFVSIILCVKKHRSRWELGRELLRSEVPVGRFSMCDRTRSQQPEASRFNFKASLSA